MYVYFFLQVHLIMPLYLMKQKLSQDQLYLVQPAERNSNFKTVQASIFINLLIQTTVYKERINFTMMGLFLVTFNEDN